MMMSAYSRLDQLAQEYVGDGKSPNLYFVALESSVVTVTTDRRTAYQHWRALVQAHPRQCSSLEDREHGVLASLEPRDDAPGARLELIDQYAALTGDREAAD